MGKEFLFLFCFGIFLLVLPAVMAVTTIDSPIANGNYSGTLNISVSTDALNNVTNTTCYYNSSGGAATTWLTEILNTSAAQTVFENASFSISSLTDAATYNISCGLTGDVSPESSNAGITIDNTPPTVTTFYNTIDGGSYSGTIVVNVSVNDSIMGVESVYFNITNSSGVQLNFTKASTVGGTGYYNLSLNTTGFTEGKFNITVYANDTQLNNLNNSEKIQITIDNTNPSVSLSKSSSTRNSLTITISGKEGACTTNRGSISGSTLTETGLSCSTSYSYTVTCTDLAGNSGSSASTSFKTDSCTSSGIGGGGSKPKEKINSWTKITPGAVTIMKNFDKEFGIKEIIIEVNNEAQNVKITVTKYDGKPAEVSVEKTGKVNKYLQIDTQNLVGKLNKAVVSFKVEKSWVSDNGLNMEDIALFKFDEISNGWEELTTTYSDSDNDYYYYHTELTSFSYFAISESVSADVVGDIGSEETTPEDSNMADEESKQSTSTFWIIFILLIIVGTIVWFKFYNKEIKIKKK